MNFNNRCINFTALLSNLLFALLFTSCEKIPETKKSTSIQVKEGLIFEENESKPFTGKIKDTLEGRIIEYGVVEGRKNGMFKTFYMNGKVEMIGLIENNLNQGKWTYFYENGQIESEGNFLNDTVNGWWKWYFEDGILKEEGNFVNGSREGKWVIYNPDGSIKEVKELSKNTFELKD